MMAQWIIEERNRDHPSGWVAWQGEKPDDATEEQAREQVKVWNTELIRQGKSYGYRVRKLDGAAYKD